MIPANVREAMERVNRDDQCTDEYAFMTVALYAVPVLERLDAKIGDRQREINEHIDLANACTDGTMARAHADCANRLEDEIYTLQTILGDT